MLSVSLSCTANYTCFLAAAVRSLRSHNKSVPLHVWTDFDGGVLLKAVSEDDDCSISTDPPAGERPTETEWVRSRLLKIASVAHAASGVLLYLDSDTLVHEDVANVLNEVDCGAGSEHDVFMLLNRPAPHTLWGDRKLYVKDSSISRNTLIELIHEVFGVNLPLSALQDVKCWNSGVIVGRSPAMRLLGSRWLELYLKMLSSPRNPEMIPRDQLALWLAAWELRDIVSIGELPERWNFMAGNFLGIPRGTPRLSAADSGRLNGAAIVHLAQNKLDPWALERISSFLPPGSIDGILSIDAAIEAIRPDFSRFSGTRRTDHQEDI